MSVNTPGVQIQEISTLPPSVAEVSTAIPAFIGYTEKGPQNQLAVQKVKNLLEFIETFGGPEKAKFSASTDAQGKLSISFSENGQPSHFLYYAINHYFNNGGGACYIASVGNYTDNISKADLNKGLEAIKTEDEPTLLVIPEACSLSKADFNSVCQAALAQCAELKDRFSILDVREGKVGDFRDGTGTANLKYGAAYHPYLQTSLNYQYQDSDVNVSTPGENEGAENNTATLDSIESSQTALYNAIKSALGEMRVQLPPSAAIAGVYASVDRQRGVWKAPANVSLNAVIKPVSAITAADQDSLNVDPTAGKSINAIRTFNGKGVMVWGARTLAGNDNEWRYVPVRRLFITIEESLQKATGFAVFEPNDANTWVKVKGMIEGYLYGLWEKGALQGSTPESAYFVQVGLGTTMTDNDVLEGRMKVKIGIAAVRPAEFIILQFTHQLAQA